MMYASHMLMIGSTGRNSGKTTLACRLIERLRNYQAVAAAKVTTIQEREGVCPRGGAGCGACAAVDGQYELIEEREAGAAKDTQRLLSAGAHKVYWLRVMKEYLEAGGGALRDAGGAMPLICESNSLRSVLEPGLFLMCRNRNTVSFKASAQSVAAHADAFVTFDGRDFDLDLDDLELLDAHWVLRYTASAIVLAGGKSARMGQDKSLMMVNGRPLIAHLCGQLRPHFDQLLVSTNEPDKHAFLKTGVVRDETPGEGPLMGIVSALAASPHDRNLVVACDVPYFDARLVRRLLREVQSDDAAAPVATDGEVEPLYAVYRKSALVPLGKALAAGERSVRAALKHCRVKRVDTDAGACLPNLNTPEEYEAFVAGVSDGQ